MEAEIEIMQLQAKECHPPPEKGKILPQNLQRKHDTFNTLILSFYKLLFHNCEEINFSCYKPPNLWYSVTAAIGNYCTLLSENDFQWCVSQFYESTEKAGPHNCMSSVETLALKSPQTLPLYPDQARNPLVEQGLVRVLVREDLQYDQRVQAWPQGPHLFWVLRAKIFLLQNQEHTNPCTSIFFLFCSYNHFFLYFTHIRDRCAV